MKAEFNGFPKEARRFLTQLKKNNNRDWFLAHKEVYDQKVKQPMVEFLTALKTEIQNFAPEFDFDPVRSIFRIYRDVRFSSDKTPYKTNIAASLNPGRARNLHQAAGYYIHLDAKSVLIAGGIYHPPPLDLLIVRKHIAANSQQFKKILGNATLRSLFGGLQGEQLKRVPKGFPPDHPAADLLKYKMYILWVELKPEVAESSELLAQTVKHFRAMQPFLKFVNEGLKAMPRKLGP